MKQRLQLVFIALAIGAVAYAFRDVDWGHSWALLERIGPWALLIPLPFFLGAIADTTGWRFVLKGLGHKVPARLLVRVRIATEALLLSMIGGALLAEGAAPYLLKTKAGVPTDDGVAAQAIRKLLLVTTQGIYISIGAILGWDFLSKHSESLLGFDGLPNMVLAFGAAMTLIAASFALLLRNGRLGARTHALLAKLPSPRLRARLQNVETEFQSLDDKLKDSARTWHRPFPIPFYLAVWFLESLETFLILRLLGVELSYIEVLAFEPALALVRNLVFVVPAGLGVQDIGYLAFIGLMTPGDPKSVAAAFLLLKRTKELLWVLIGYGLWGALRTQDHPHKSSV